MHGVNPYSGRTFGEFFLTLARRLWQKTTGEVPWNDLASDEIQVLVLFFIALSSALVGTFLVLRRMTMLANSLSHTILLGIVVAFLIGHSEMQWQNMDLKTLLIASFFTGIFTTILTRILHQGMHLQEDASIGLTFTTLFALGILLVTLFTRNTHLGVEAIMGNVDALHLHDLKMAFFLFIFNGLLLFVFFKPFLISTFDPALGRNFKIPLSFLSYLLMVQSAATAIGAFRAVGVFLFLALLVTPVLTARFFTHNLKKLLVLSALIGSVASLFAVALSRHLLSVYHLPLSTAGLVTMMLGGLFLCGVLKRSLPSGKMERR